MAALEQVPAALLALSGPVAKPVLESVTYDELGAYVGAPQGERRARHAASRSRQAAEKSDEEKQAEQEQQAEAETAASRRRPRRSRPRT